MEGLAWAGRPKFLRGVEVLGEEFSLRPKKELVWRRKGRWLVVSELLLMLKNPCCSVVWIMDI